MKTKTSIRRLLILSAALLSSSVASADDDQSSWGVRIWAMWECSAYASMTHNADQTDDHANLFAKGYELSQNLVVAAMAGNLETSVLVESTPIGISGLM